VEVLCRHVSDDAPTVRRLCLRGLVQVLYVILTLRLSHGIHLHGDKSELFVCLFFIYLF